MDQEAVSPMVGAKSDASLVARARSGDESAWAAIVEHHWRRVWRLSRIVVRDEHGAEEVAQETFRAVRERLDAAGSDAALGGWIQSICRERAMDELRRRGRQPGAASADDRVAEGPDLERALAALEPEQRAALLLTEAGSTPEDLAAALAVTAATIRSRSSLARARLLDELDRGGAE
jgi:RNA polymerase sigma-70 factor (ECF subfamily)